MPKVLIVEDEQSIRSMLHIALEKGGMQVVEAANGQEALTLVFQEKPNVILLDVIMPKMHGIDMLNALQADAWGKKVPVILLTNYADDPRVIKVVDEKRCDLMRKEESRVEDIICKIQEKLSGV
jgi:CheY-like chemotaxis protein